MSDGHGTRCRCVECRRVSVHLSPEERCDDLTRTPKGYLRCIRPLGHKARPGRPPSLHQVDFKDGTWLLTRPAAAVLGPDGDTQ